MQITHEEKDNKGIFHAIEQDREAGFMTYSRVDANQIIIDHTEVHPGFEGKGVGKQLVLQAADYARDHQQKILPLCPFAKKVFDKTEAIHDVLFQGPTL